MCLIRHFSTNFVHYQGFRNLWITTTPNVRLEITERLMTKQKCVKHGELIKWLTFNKRVFIDGKLKNKLIIHTY